MTKTVSSKISIQHTIQAVAGLLFVVVPLVTKLTDAHPLPAHASVILGFLLTLFSNGRVVVLAKTFFDSLFPESGGSSIRHSLQAGAGLILLVGPVTSNLLKTWPHTTYICTGLGFAVTLLSNARFVVLAKTILNIFFPEKSSSEGSPVVASTSKS